MKSTPTQYAAKFAFIAVAYAMISMCVSCASMPVGGAGKPTPFHAPTVAEQIVQYQSKLGWAGFALLVLGLLAFFFAFFCSSKLGDWIDYCRNGGMSAALVGLLLIVTAIFFKAVVYTVAGCIAVALLALAVGIGSWLYFHRSDILPYLGKKADQAAATISGLGTPSPTKAA